MGAKVFEWVWHAWEDAERRGVKLVSVRLPRAYIDALRDFTPLWLRLAGPRYPDEVGTLLGISVRARDG